MTPGRPDITTTVTDLTRRVAQLEAQTMASNREWRDPDGRLRVRVGVQADGRWGVRAWNAAGVLIVDQTAT